MVWARWLVYPAMLCAFLYANEMSTYQESFGKSPKWSRQFKLKGDKFRAQRGEYWRLTILFPNMSHDLTTINEYELTDHLTVL